MYEVQGVVRGVRRRKRVYGGVRRCRRCTGCKRVSRGVSKGCAGVQLGPRGLHLLRPRRSAGAPPPNLEQVSGPGRGEHAVHLLRVRVRVRVSARVRARVRIRVRVRVRVRVGGTRVGQY